MAKQDTRTITTQNMADVAAEMRAAAERAKEGAKGGDFEAMALAVQEVADLEEVAKRAEAVTKAVAFYDRALAKVERSGALGRWS